jgi:hypothetical protein
VDVSGESRLFPGLSHSIRNVKWTGQMIHIRREADDLRHRLPDDLTTDLLRFAASLVTLVAAIFLGLVRIG